MWLCEKKSHVAQTLLKLLSLEWVYKDLSVQQKHRNKRTIVFFSFFQKTVNKFTWKAWMNVQKKVVFRLFCDRIVATEQQHKLLHLKSVIFVGEVFTPFRGVPKGELRHEWLGVERKREFQLLGVWHWLRNEAKAWVRRAIYEQRSGEGESIWGGAEWEILEDGWQLRWKEQRKMQWEGEWSNVLKCRKGGKCWRESAQWEVKGLNEGRENSWQWEGTKCMCELG